MNGLLLLGLLVLNGGISAWNAYASGAYLTESKEIGGWIKFVVWCGLVMSACGFTWVYLCLLTIGAVATGKLSPEEAMVMFNLGYLIIFLPMLGSGLGIWAHSIAVAYRERSFGSVAVAGWNSFAQAHNTWEAASHAPSAWREVRDYFSDSDVDGDSAKGILMILVVIVAVGAGILTTAAIARWADRRVAINVTSNQPVY